MVKSQRPKRQSAQSANRFVGKYLDVKRVHLPRTDDHAVAQNYSSGVGGARRGVRERRCKLPQSGADEQRNETRHRQQISTLEGRTI